MNDSFVLIFAALCGLIVGVVLTISGANDLWIKDCEKMGAHRFGDVVYICSFKANA